MFRYLLSILSLLIISPCFGDIASSEYVNEMRDNVQAKIDKKADNSNYTQNMVLQTDNSGNVVATTVGTDLFADGAIETMHLTDGAVTNADLAGMIDITKLNLGTLPTRGKHMMIWNAELNEYVFERYATSILPDDYTQLMYIGSTGTQYIDTGIVRALTDDVECNFSEYIGGALFGTENLDPQTVIITTGRTSYFKNNSSGDAPHIIRYEDVNEHNVVFETNGDIYIDGFLRLSATVVGASTSSIYLFSRKTAQLGISKIHSFRIGEKFNGVPAKRNSDGEIGIYDTVTGQFFTNAGTGTFIAGPEIE